ncbi:MAG: hypothetical protein AAEJ52_06605 [Myxococcota bacterium]
MKATEFRAILTELVDENPFAVRAVLQILTVEFTQDVPTLAVTTGEQPRLLVNLEFIDRHCATDAHVKAVICHEFLHDLLRHTERTGPITPPEHLAMDAVINAIIHRTLGDEYSDMMKTYYRDAKGLECLLRPPPIVHGQPQYGGDGLVVPAWSGLYGGRLVADDIRDLARDLEKDGACLAPTGGFLGNHDDPHDEPVSEIVNEALDRAMKGMNGDGIWRSPSERGVGTNAYENLVLASPEGLDRWRRTTYAVLRKHLTPDRRGPRERTRGGESRLPVLHPGHRRSFMQAIWSPLIPDAVWPQSRWVQRGTAQIYLDVSGSMNAEMPLIVGLLVRLSRHIRRPFWAFSNHVAPARIENGALVAETTGGTSMGCVLEHLARTAPPRAIVITDGYIEQLSRWEVDAASGTRIHALITRDGNSQLLQAAGIPYTQLGRLPQ